VKGADREGEEREGQRRVGEERRGREAAGRRADGSEAAEGVGGRVWGSVELISIYTSESGPKIDSPCVVVGVGAAGVRGRLRGQACGACGGRGGVRVGHLVVCHVF
jgi:hypothetical protein